MMAWQQSAQMNDPFAALMSASTADAIILLLMRKGLIPWPLLLACSWGLYKDRGT
jgi:hypothetical protein